jgi:hypothetical protein
MLEAVLYVKSSKLLEHCSIPTITIALKSRCVYRIIGHRDNVLFSAAVWCAWHDLQRFRVFRFHPYANQVLEPISRFPARRRALRVSNITKPFSSVRNVSRTTSLESCGYRPCFTEARATAVWCHTSLSMKVCGKRGRHAGCLGCRMFAL